MHDFHGLEGKVRLRSMGEGRASDLKRSQSQGAGAGTNMLMLLNAMRRGDGSAGIGALYPTPGACLEKRTMQS